MKLYGQETFKKDQLFPERPLSFSVFLICFS